MTVLRMSPVSLKCNATIAIVKVSRRNIEQTVRKNNQATQVTTNRTQTKTSYLINKLKLATIKLQHQHRSLDLYHSSTILSISSLLLTYNIV